MMIDQLEENLTLENYAEHMEDIHRLARSRDASCRIRLADLLCGFPNSHAKDTLLALTEDASYLVQTSAIDSLSHFRETIRWRRPCGCPPRGTRWRGDMPISAREWRGVRWAMRSAQACETGCLPYGKPIHYCPTTTIVTSKKEF